MTSPSATTSAGWSTTSPRTSTAGRSRPTNNGLWPAEPDRRTVEGGRLPGCPMKRITSGTCTALLTLAIVGATGAPAHAQVSGAESFDGKLVVHSDAAGNRNVLASVVRMDGVFKGVGQIVEQ